MWLHDEDNVTTRGIMNGKLVIAVSLGCNDGMGMGVHRAVLQSNEMTKVYKAMVLTRKAELLAFQVKLPIGTKTLKDEESYRRRGMLEILGLWCDV
jgi:hypothetical protein